MLISGCHLQNLNEIDKFAEHYKAEMYDQDIVIEHLITLEPSYIIPFASGSTKLNAQANDMIRSVDRSGNFIIAGTYGSDSDKARKVALARSKVVADALNIPKFISIYDPTLIGGQAYIWKISPDYYSTLRTSNRFIYTFDATAFKRLN